MQTWVLDLDRGLGCEASYIWYFSICYLLL